MPNRTADQLARPQGQSIPRLQRRLQRLLAIGVAATTCLVGLATSLPMYLQLSNKIDLHAELDVQVRALASSHLLEHMADTAMQLTSRSEIRRMLERYNAGEIELAELQAFTAPRLREPLAQAADVLGLVRLDARGQPVLALRQPVPREHWPIPAADQQLPRLVGPLLIGDTPVLLVGAPILSPDGRRAGTDIAAFTLDRLRDLLPMTDGYSGDMQIHLINVAERRAVHVHDADTALLATPDWHPLFAALRQASDLPLHAVRLPEHERLGALVAFARPLPEHGDWAIALLSPRDVLYAGARAELLWPLLGILLLGLAGGGLIFMLARPLLQRMLEQSQSLGLAASVFEHSNEGILLLDERQRIIGLNPAGSRLLRCRLAELEGRRACEALLLDTSEADCAAMWAQVSRTGSWQSEVTLLRGDGEAFSAWLSLAAVYDEQRRPSHFTGLFTDISAAKEEQERILQMAYHDRLTGLPNRSLVRDRLTQALRQARRQGSLLAVLFLDLDRFKPVNDTFGHAVGDLLLRAVAERLAQTVRDSDTVARLGGDEFLIVLEDLDDVAMAERIAGRLVEALQQPFPIDGHVLHIGTSIGIALYPDDGSDAAELVRKADAAMYRAKDNGRNRYAFHDQRQRTLTD
ncbi:diguanylate cyclase [Pseudomonas sp. A-1]|uniref:diguanylate cyclase domain-containing protein n=1 Tax=Pseudomonas sp. A-1 TaxID=1821274 RepID=UPI0010A5B2B4|nr:diguanylate cyclase [Pseudomonas sp. A-1]THG71181.1 diguanylate cyclase [Pseudomonas sp. A-1]